MADIRNFFERLNEADNINLDEDFKQRVYTEWMTFINGETDHDKLLELAEEFIKNIRDCIEDDRGELLA